MKKLLTILDGFIKKTLPIIYAIIVIEVLCIATLSALGGFQQKPMLGQQINWAHPASKGLVGIWLFNERSGNKVFDLSGNGNTILFDETPDWVAGNYGPMVKCLSGSSESLYINDNLSQRVSEITLVICVQIHETPGINERCFEKEYDNAGANPYVSWGFEWKSATEIKFIAADTLLTVNNSLTYTAGVAFPLNSKLWFAGTCNANKNHKIYRDGIEVASRTNTVGPITQYSATGNQVDIAGRLNSGNYISQSLEYAFLYNRALSASEVALLHREPFCMFEQDNIALMAVEAPAPGGGQVIMITSLPWILSIPLLYGIVYLRTKYKEAA